MSAPAASPAPAAAGTPKQGSSLAALSLGALGVVFGDIGTSPIYAFRESMQQVTDHDVAFGALGVISLIFWSLLLVVGVKYLVFVMRADNRGEGGIFALLAQIHGEKNAARRRITIPVMIILAGAALFYGDGVITPAISVLSAAEGFKTLHPVFAPGPSGHNTWVVAIAAFILAVLFFVQHRGTRRIGQAFGPVILVWFTVIGGLGLWWVIQVPEVLHGLSPHYAVRLMLKNPWEVFAILGAVVLAITGAEALYADMGHFGRRSIKLGWYGVVLPGLMLNYLGQGAYVLSNPETYRSTSPFYALAPEGLPRLLLVGLAIAATIIASQALISATFSLTRQAIQLGFFPRLKVLHTNPDQEGQIYLPLVNWALAIGCIATVIGFKTSDSLAAAYGIAVTGTMTVTTYAFFLVTRHRWKWAWPLALVVCGGFFVVDALFLFSTLNKILDGGWLPIAIALGLIAIMRAWKKGRYEIVEKIYGAGDTEIELAQIARSAHVVRVPGSAVFMAATPRGTPLALLHHLKANRSLQRVVVLLSIVTENIPVVAEVSRIGLEDCGEGVWRVIVRYGYMESPDVERVIQKLQAVGVPVQPMQTTYFFNREMVVTGGQANMWEWEKHLYSFLSRNARPARDYFNVPHAQIIEIGLPVQL